MWSSGAQPLKIAVCFMSPRLTVFYACVKGIHDWATDRTLHSTYQVIQNFIDGLVFADLNTSAPANVAYPI
jgi:hypothetical protein